MHDIKELLIGREGQIGRLDYFLGVATLLILSLIFTIFIYFHAEIMTTLAFSNYVVPFYLTIFFLLSVAAPIVIFGSYYKITLKRLRNVNIHGNWAWLIIVPGANLMLSLYLILTPESISTSK